MSIKTEVRNRVAKEHGPDIEKGFEDARQDEEERLVQGYSSHTHRSVTITIECSFRKAGEIVVFDRMLYAFLHTLIKAWEARGNGMSITLER